MGLFWYDDGKGWKSKKIDEARKEKSKRYLKDRVEGWEVKG